MNTTLNRIRAEKPGMKGWAKLLAGLNKTKADAEPLALVTILNLNGLEYATWALRCIDDQAQVRRYAVWCARQVQHLMTDSRSLAALDVAERYADGQATKAELAEASDAAWPAANNATWWAGWAASAAASAAASGAARTAARASARAARASARAAVRGARDAAQNAARAAQEAQFRLMFGGDV